MPKLELTDLTQAMLEEVKCKKWYKSKTMWLNVVTGAYMFTEGLGVLLTGMPPIIDPVVMPWVIFGVAMLNLFLRTITSMAVEK